MRHLILYEYPPSGNSYKVRLLLHQLEIPFERRVVDILRGETHSPDYLEKNPMGQVPVLGLEDGTSLRESSAILQHVASGTPLFPDEPLLRTRVIEWLCFEQSNVDQVIARARFRRLFPAAIPTRPEEFVAWYKHGYRALTVLETHLSGRTFVVAETYSIADIALYGYIHCAHEGGFDLGPYPSVRRWLDQVRSTPGFVVMDS